MILDKKKNKNKQPNRKRCTPTMETEKTSLVGYKSIFFSSARKKY
jgi:hypothetical protein